ncbi:hypothetical protein [Halocatena marina]|uniref:hypothetical protein n=1 Tax=Halocatena marina TaxID=2934937 RepID=UPI0036F3C876
MSLESTERHCFRTTQSSTRSTNRFVGENVTALNAAATVAQNRGYEPLVLTSRLRGEA